MNKNQWKALYEKYRYEVIGAVVGFVFAILMIVLNPFRAMVILFFTLLGIVVGKILRKDKNYIRDILDKILPPGGFR